MSKEYIQAFNIIKFNPDNVDGLQYLEAFKVVEQALQRLESIDNVEPSEAWESLENIEADLTGLPKHVTEYDDGFDNYLEDIWYRIDTIKHAVLKAQKLKIENAKYKQLEEELGCPLEVREKAFDNGFYDVDGNHYFCEHYVPYSKAMHTRGIMNGTSKSFKLKDYKKTWWLKENRSE